MSSKTPTIVIRMGDEPPDPNPTLIDMLRDGERPKPGEPGTLADRLGQETQDYLAHQARVARHRRTAVKGSITLTIATVTGPDGSSHYAVEVRKKEAKIPPASSLVFVDEGGGLMNRPVEPLTELANRRQKEADEAASKKKSTKPETPDPKAGAPSSL